LTSTTCTSEVASTGSLAKMDKKIKKLIHSILLRKIESGKWQTRGKQLQQYSFFYWRNSPKREIRKSSEFGVFQSPELRKKSDKSFQIFILGF
jgi:hypothetical protein